MNRHKGYQIIVFGEKRCYKGQIDLRDVADTYGARQKRGQMGWGRQLTRDI